MAVPANPTPTSIVTQALKRGGRTTPTPAQITEALEDSLQEVKADIMLKAETHPNLVTTSTTVTVRGMQRYTVPEDFNAHQSIMLLDGPDEWRGVAQGGSATGIILASTFPPTSDEVVGKYIIITSGSGMEEYREIIAYDAGTRTATIDNAWLSTPVAGSTYLVIQSHIQLWPQDTATEVDRIINQTALGAPRIGAVSGQEFLIYPVPDKSTYGLLNRYWADLSKLDEDGDLFIQLLREWRSIWIQGVAVKTMQRFDEDRYTQELQIYNAMLDMLGSQTGRVTQARFHDV